MADRLFKYIWIGIIVGVVAIWGGITQAYYLNMANLSMLNWVFGIDRAQASQALTSAAKWGEKVSSAPHGQLDRVQSLRKRFIDDPTIPVEEQAFRDYDIGRVLEEYDKLPSALARYQKACDPDLHFIDACYRVIRVAELLGEESVAREQTEALYNLQPKYPLNVVLDTNFVLSGYDLDEIGLEWGGAPFGITVFWDIQVDNGGGWEQGLDQWEEDGWLYIRVKDRLFQVGQVDNLLPNAGFEHNLTHISDLPIGYYDVAYSARYDRGNLAEHHRLDSFQRDGLLTQAAVVMNPDNQFTGLTTITYPAVKPGELYLLGGWMQTDGDGRGTLGGVWRDAGKTDILYWYIAEDMAAEQWQYLTDAMIAPPDARLFTLLALNIKTSGDVVFDNLLLIQIPTPTLEIE